MHKNRRLTFADRQLGPIFDLVVFTLKSPDHGVAGVVSPMDDVDKLARQKIENAHVVLLQTVLTCYIVFQKI